MSNTLLTRTDVAAERHRACIGQLVQALRVWLALAAIMGCMRLAWYWELREQIPDGVQWFDWLAVVWQGARQDMSIAGYLTLPLIALGLLAACREGVARLAAGCRSLTVVLGAIFYPLLTYCSVGYYEAFTDCFDTMVFELFRGNGSMALAAAMQEHQLLARLATSVVASGLILAAWRFCRGKCELRHLAELLSPRSTSGRMLAAAACFAAVFVSLRGGVGKRPVQKIDSSVTSFTLLNRGAVNPILALKLAYGEHRRTLARQGRKLDAELVLVDLKKHRALIADDLAPDELPKDLSEDQLNFETPLLRRVAEGSPNRAPSHVFFLFLESYDSWPMLDQFAHLGIADGGKQLAKEGLWLRTFLPAGNNSIVSCLGCIQGLQQTDQARQRRTPTSLVELFRRLGHVTRQVNGFPADWCDTLDISAGQGFDQVYCVEDIVPGGETSNHQLHDRTLYEFVDRLPFDRPSFNFIRSSSNHGPWEVDLAREGTTVDRLPETVDGRAVTDPERRKIVYGHAKYADRMMSDFVRRTIQKFPDALFVITGDHYGRNYITHEPNIYCRSSVPLILYGPQVLAGLKLPVNAAGSQLDLGATLAELCAPAGFQYASLGRNLLKPTASPFGVGTGFVIFSDVVVSLAHPASIERLPWSGGEIADPQRRIAQARELHDLYQNLGFLLSSRPTDGVVRR